MPIGAPSLKLVIRFCYWNTRIVDKKRENLPLVLQLWSWKCDDGRMWRVMLINGTYEWKLYLEAQSRKLQLVLSHTQPDLPCLGWGKFWSRHHVNHERRARQRKNSFLKLFPYGGKSFSLYNWNGNSEISGSIYENTFDFFDMTVPRRTRHNTVVKI